MANSEIKVLGRMNGLDFAILVVLLTAFLGFGLARAGHAGVNKVIQGTAKVAIDVYIIGLKTKDLGLFKVGEKSAFTIRNQPVYPPMTILAVKEWPKSIAFLPPGAKAAVAMPDPSQMFAHDYLVTVADQADITADGYVIRGNKIKVGNMVELEGFKYRVQGVVVDIQSINQ